MIELFRLSLRDFLTKKFILLSILPLLFCVVILGGIMIFGGREIYEILSIGASSGDFSFLDEERFPLIATILSSSFTKWIITTLFYTAGAFLVLMLSVFIAVIVAGFLTPIITAEINRRYYQIDQLADVSTTRTIKLITVVVLKFLGLFLAALPFLFVPVLNLFALQIPFFYLYYSLLFIDIAPNTLRQNKFELYLLDMGGYKFKAVCLMFYLLCLVPFVGLLGQIYFIIYFSHFFLQKEKYAKLDTNHHNLQSSNDKIAQIFTKD